MKTEKSSYPDVVRALLGRPGGLALEISIVLRCFGALFWLTQSTKALWLHSRSYSIMESTQGCCLSMRL